MVNDYYVACGVMSITPPTGDTKQKIQTFVTVGLYALVSFQDRASSLFRKYPTKMPGVMSSGILATDGGCDNRAKIPVLSRVSRGVRLCRRNLITL